jgi:hypothetical protein
LSSAGFEQILLTSEVVTMRPNSSAVCRDVAAKVSLPLAALSLLAFAQPALAQDSLYVTPGGKVGIGTSTPANTLHVAGGNAVLDNTRQYTSLDSGGVERGLLMLSSANDTLVNAKAGQKIAFTLGLVGKAALYSNGSFGVGTVTPSFRLDVQDPAIDGNVLRLLDSDAACTANPETTGVVWSCSSDLLLKGDIRPADTAGILEDLARLDLYQYQVLSTGETKVGPVAQSLELSHPDRVTTTRDGSLMVELPSTSDLLAAIQELHDRVAALQAEVAALQTEPATPSDND